MTPFDRLGRFVVRRAWWVVGAWVALLLVAIPFAPQVPGRLSAGGFILDDLESARAKTLLATAGESAESGWVALNMAMFEGASRAFSAKKPEGKPDNGGGSGTSDMDQLKAELAALQAKVDKLTR